MELLLQRTLFTPTATIGELSVDGAPECMTLEDVVRLGDIFAVKVPGATAIPAGRYEVRVTFSPKFGKELPEIRSVPNFTGIRIHTGNFPRDTAGCVLVGRSKGVDRIFDSNVEDVAGPGVAPVAATRAISTQGPSKAMMAPPSKEGMNVPLVLAVTAGVLALGVVATLVVGAVAGLF